MNAASPEDHKACDCNKPGCDCSMPQVTFSTFILSLASSALVQLGEVPNPESGATEQDLVIAKHTIDILTICSKKRPNNASTATKPAFWRASCTNCA